MPGKFGTEILYAVRTDRGLCRNVNQDAVAAFVKDRTGLFVLADGMGGHIRGELASQAVTVRFQNFWRDLQWSGPLKDFRMLSDQVQNVILSVNQEIYEKYNQGQICGATVAVLLISDGCYAFFSVGDSRIYSYENRYISRLTVDDIWDNLPSVTGFYTREEIAASKNSGKLTQAVGVKPQVCVHVGTEKVRRGQRFLVCSDGLYKFCEEEKIRKSLRHISSEKALQKAADRLMREVFDNGAEDNVSFLLVSVK